MISSALSKKGVSVERDEAWSTLGTGVTYSVSRRGRRDVVNYVLWTARELGTKVMVMPKSFVFLSLSEFVYRYYLLVGRKKGNQQVLPSAMDARSSKCADLV